MKKVLKIELDRAFRNGFFLISLAFGIAIVLTDVWETRKFIVFNDYIKGYPSSLWQHWIGTEFTSSMKTLYFMVAPMLAALPHADSYFSDRAGYRKHICLRTERRQYLAAKYIAVLTSGGAAFVIPMIVGLVASACIFPASAPQSATSTFAVSEFAILQNLFVAHPLIYSILYLCIDFVTAGLLAEIGLAVSLFAKNRFVVLLSPFIVFLGWSFISDSFDLFAFDYYYILSPSQRFPKSFGYPELSTTLMITLLFAATFPVFLLKGGAEDVI